MSFATSIEEQELIAESYKRAGSGISARERAAELVLGGGFVAAVIAIWVLDPPTAFSFWPAALCVAVLTLATTVRFDTSFGFTVPTQLGFVPLLFAVPPAIVPIAVVLSLTLAQLHDVITGKLRPSRMLMSLGNAWFAIGPAVVFAATNTRPADAGTGLLLVALGAQFFGDFCASTLRYAISREATFAAQVRETWWVYVIDAALTPIGLLAAQDVVAAPLSVLAPVPLLGILAMFARERRGRIESLLKLSDAYRGTALVLGDVVEADDGYTGEHSQGVVRVALAVADELGLAPDERRNLEFGALLHDVGKIVIPKEIINKPGPLAPDEWAIIKTHTIEGQQMLDRVGGSMREVGLVVRSHHERWDGHGYPDGLAGEQIPLEARIICCCDAWNAMRTDRVYRKALTYDAALAEVRVNRGAQFDPRVADALIAVVEREAERDRSDRAALPYAA